MKRQIKSKGSFKNLTSAITFIIVMLFVIYTTIASAALNANLQISGEAKFVPDHTFTKNFDYTGSCEEYVIPKSGLYKLETWGASGGNPASGMSGKGGYSAGTVTLFQNTKLYICVGGQGKTGAVTTGNQILAGGFNGGGNAWGFSDGNNGSGGGATDIRIGTNSLYARVIVAGGGGGAVSAGDGPQAGHGGGSSGLAGKTNYSGGCTANGGTQTAGGSGSNCGTSFTPGQTGTTYNASFGQGGSGRKAGITENRAGGGGGWYGGGSTFIIGGGGSGFVWVSGASIPSGYILTDNYYLSDTENINGGDTIPSHDGSGTMNGNQGNGFAKISLIEIVSDDVEFYLNGSADMQINVGSTYTEQGATLYINDVNYSSSVTVTGTVTSTVAGTYTRTYTYTYNGTVYKLIRRILVQNAIAYTGSFSYTGAQQSITAPYTGWYKLEVWGAQGGKGQESASGTGGLGGYATGIVWLPAGTTLYIYVGQQGNQFTSGDYALGGWNGGGHGSTGSCTTQRKGGSGGGGTDIRIGGTTAYYRAIVAGGGGGGSGRNNIAGGAAGGTSGNPGAGGGGGQGGSQTAGGTAGANGGINDRPAAEKNGSFSQGGHGNGSGGVQKGSWNGGGGGGGWYGGGAGSNSTTPLLNCNDDGNGGAGGGGSSFIWYNGASIPTGYSVSSNYHMGGTSTTANSRSGNGLATITFLES